MWMLMAGLAQAACAGCASTPVAVSDLPIQASLTEVAAPTYDHSYKALDAVYDGIVKPDGVDYVGLRTRKAQLDAVVVELSGAPVSTFTHDQQVAFWANAYNAITLQLIVDNPQIDSIMKLDEGQVWKARSFQVGGESITLDAIEHTKLRPITDGRVHAIISCASKGCPPLGRRPLSANNLEQQLDAGAHRWVMHNAYKQRGDTLYLSEIFKWFPEDFEKWRKRAVPGANEAQTRAVWFLASYADKNVEERVTAGAFKVQWQPYDWSLNQSSP